MIAIGKFLAKVLPLVHQLAVSLFHLIVYASRYHFCFVKAVTASVCLSMCNVSVIRNASKRIGVSLEAVQLGMVTITFSFTPQHILCQQHFALKRD